MPQVRSLHELDIVVFGRAVYGNRNRRGRAITLDGKFVVPLVVAYRDASATETGVIVRYYLCGLIAIAVLLVAAAAVAAFVSTVISIGE